MNIFTTEVDTHTVALRAWQYDDRIFTGQFSIDGSAWYSFRYEDFNELGGGVPSSSIATFEGWLDDLAISRDDSAYIVEEAVTKYFDFVNGWSE